jgi:hypothetical protein
VPRTWLVDGEGTPQELSAVVKPSCRAELRAERARLNDQRADLQERSQAQP